MHGNRRTNPSGIDILEFPFNRIRLRKNANLERTRLFSSFKSLSDGMFGVEGSRFDTRCIHSILRVAGGGLGSCSDAPERGQDSGWCPQSQFGLP